MAETTLTGEPPTTARKRRSPGRGAGWLRGTLPFPGAIAGGLLLFLAFPPVDAWALAPVGVAAMTLALYRQRATRAAALGFCAGLGFFLPLLSWIQTLGVSGVWAALTVLQALYFVPLGAGLALVTRLPAWPVTGAALWVAEEAVRGRVPFGGLTWGRLAFSQGRSPFTPYAAVAGAPLVSFLVALAGGLAAWAAVHAARRLRSRGSIPGRPGAGAGDDNRAVARGLRVPAAALALAVAVPALGLALPVPVDGRKATVAAVQGDVPRSGLDAFGQRRAVLNNHVQATHRLARRVATGAAPAPDFVVWPENASDIDPYATPEARRQIQQAVQDVGVPVLVGAMTDRYTRNIGIVWHPQTGPGETYLKRHLVPFGEYIPFRDLVTRYLSVVETLRPRDVVPGTEPGRLTVAGIPIADAICFDVAYDHTVREAVNGGARLLVVQTNNATFGRSAQPKQQLAIERLRAVEHGRAVVVASTSGISAIIAPDGRLLAESELFTRDILVEDIPLRSQRTLADRLGSVPEWTLTALGALAVLGGAAVARGVQVASRRRPR